MATTRVLKSCMALLMAGLTGCAPAESTGDARVSARVMSAREAAVSDVARPDPVNATYDIEGQSVTLVNGVAEGPPVAPDSATRERTVLLGSPVYGDLDGDGDEDAAVLLARELGGSGTFVYFAAVTQEAQGQQGSNAFLLGDRVGSPKVRIEQGAVHVNFLGRPEDASFADPPSEPKALRATMEAGRLVLPPPG